MAETPRAVSVAVDFTDQEYKLISGMAANTGMTVEEFTRWAALSRAEHILGNGLTSE